MQKIIARAGIASRRAAEQLILEGRVTLDGQVVAELGRTCDPRLQTLCVDGKPVGGEEKMVYFLLNKPKGYLSTVKDERGRRTILDLLSGVRERVYPVGRLDNNTEGLLLVTNDGPLTNGLLHPRCEVEKIYVARVAGPVTEKLLDSLRRGISLDDGMTAPARARLLEQEQGLSRVELAIHEGRNRQVRRMFAAIGCEVKSLKRTVFAGLDLKGVKRGRYRELTEEEVAGLYGLAGLGR